MEIFSVSLALCEENPAVTSGFPSQRQVTQSFEVFLDLRLKKTKQLSKQSRRWWFEMTPHSLWCHCNVITLLVLILEYCLKTKSITWPLISKLLWHQVTCNHGINPLRAKFFRGNINIYLHFLSLHHIDMTQIVEILPHVRQGPTYSI